MAIMFRGLKLVPTRHVKSMQSPIRLSLTHIAAVVTSTSPSYPATTAKLIKQP